MRSLFGFAHIPADVFVVAEHVEVGSERIVQNRGLAVERREHGRGDEARRVLLSRLRNQLANERRALVADRRLVGHGP